MRSRGAISAAEWRGFEDRVRVEAMALSPAARVALGHMLGSLAEYAEQRATASLHAKKFVMFAYWKVVAVYARHFRRLVRAA